MVHNVLRLVLLAIFFIATPVSAFVPTGSRHITAAFTVSRTSHSTITTSLSSSPAIADKPVTKEDKKIDAEKESKPSNSKGWAVRLYNDPMNKREFVARCLTEVCSLSDGAAFQCMMRAHQSGIAVIGQYHLEMAELYKSELSERGLMTDMVPVDDDK